MRYLRQFLTYALLTVYSATALLGYGLHMLVPGGHHHGPAGTLCVDQADGEFLAHYQLKGEAAGQAAADSSTFTAGSASGDSCFVCDFLAQVRGAQAEAPVTVVWQPVAAEVVDVVSQFTPLTVLGSHAPRGPPLFAA
jgi:hypothetical protein